MISASTIQRFDGYFIKNQLKFQITFYCEQNYERDKGRQKNSFLINDTFVVSHAYRLTTKTFIFAGWQNIHFGSLFLFVSFFIWSYLAQTEQRTISRHGS